MRKKKNKKQTISHNIGLDEDAREKTRAPISPGVGQRTIKN